jgi:aryl-alcohol dehydrogenase-like predicted oxidoreductase
VNKAKKTIEGKVVSKIPSLVLGTAGFSAPYGVTKQWGVPSLNKIEGILEAAQKNNIGLLDTAIAYGNCEEKLGAVGVNNFEIITKIPEIPQSENSIEKWLLNQCQDSLKRLKKNNLYGLLLHEPEQLLSSGVGEKISKSLQRIKNRGIVKKIGISIYCPSKINSLNKIMPLDIVQAPINIFDRRFLKSDILKILEKNKTELHCRSIFLQGLLLQPKVGWPKKFEKWKSLFSAYQDFLKKTKKTAVEACVSFVRAQPEIDSIVFGINNCKQLNQILKAYNNKENINVPNLNCSDIDLILPPRWRHLKNEKRRKGIDPSKL